MTDATQASEHLPFTGERVVPGEVEADLYHEHIARYELVRAFVHRRAVLDAACGAGYGAALLADEAQSILGVDVAPDAIRYADARYRRPRLHFAVGDILALPVRDATMDLVVAFEAIEHLAEPHERFLREAARVLRPGGLLVLSTPNRRTYSDATQQRNPFHVREYSADEFLALLQRVFPAVRLFAQNPIEAQTFAELGDTATTQPPRLRLMPELPHRADRDTAHFFLAVCSTDPAALDAILPAVTTVQTATGSVLAERMRWIHALQAEVAARDANAQQLQVSLDELQTRLQQVSTERAEQAETLQALEVDAAASEHSLQALRIEVDTLADSVASAVDALSSHDIEARAATVRTKVLQQRVDELERAAQHQRAWLVATQQQLEQAQRRTLQERAARQRLARYGAGIISASVDWADDGAPRSPSVSIIIAVHNHAELTNTCLDALDRTLPAWFSGEIIVVDDASTDGTRELLTARALGAERLRVLRHEENQGFLESCLTGASVATGDLLLFLNNDTIPQAGWLTALLQTVRAYPRAGAVGAKLIFPDARLQEAGGVIFSDATGLNFGKFDAASDRPLYSYVREVDYCSGAVLLTPRELFEALGGFDRRYRPGYYEDADYCFAVRASGYQVLYQPASVVVHLEGGTAGTDLTAGMKQHQVTNRERFAQKWQGVLDRQPAPPGEVTPAVLHELSRRWDRKRVLFGAPTLPEFEHEGGSRRIWHLMEFLREAGWSITFMTPSGRGNGRYARSLEQSGIATYCTSQRRPEDGAYATEAERVIALGEFDLAVLSFWEAAELYMPTIRAHSPRTKVIVDSIDLHFLRWSRGAFGRQMQREAPGELSADTALAMARELKVYAAADLVLTVSEKEAHLLGDFLADPAAARAVPQSEPPFPEPPPFEARRGLLFVGNFRHPPNVEGVEFLLREVVPRLDRQLLAQHPISIVGTDLNERVRAAARGVDHVRLVGWVPSVLPYLRQSRITVVPLLHGAGTKTKLIQAMLAGVPSVATTIGIDGLGTRDGVGVLVADDRVAFARAVERLLTDAQLWASVSQRGRELAGSRYGRETARTQFLQAVEAVLRTEMPDRREVSRRDD